MFGLGSEVADDMAVKMIVQPGADVFAITTGSAAGDDTFADLRRVKYVARLIGAFMRVRHRLACGS